MDYRNAAAACYLEERGESGHVWKAYKEKLCCRAENSYLRMEVIHES